LFEIAEKSGPPLAFIQPQPFFQSGSSGPFVPLANCKVPLGNRWSAPIGDSAVNQYRLLKHQYRGTFRGKRAETDLANAYGSLNHKMIMLVLKIYRIPTEIADLIANMYSDLHIGL
jgi:hypothetical protein